MELQRRRHQQQARSFRQQRKSREMTTFGDLAAIQMPFDPHPIIQGLQRKVDVLVHLELDHRQPAVPVNGQQIDDSTVAARELRYLTVDRLSA